MDQYQKRIFFILLLFLTDFMSFAEESDSLLNIIKSGKAEEQALAFAGMSSFYKGSNSDSSIYYALKGVELAKKSGLKRALVRCYLELGDSYLSIDSLDAAQIYFLEAEKHFYPEADTGDISLIYRKLGSIYTIRQEYYQAMNFFLKGLEFARYEKDTSSIASFYNNIGVIERNIGLTNDALEHYRLVLDLLESDEFIKRSGTLGNIGLIYYERKEADSAKHYFTKALGIAEGLNDYYIISNMLVNLGGVEFEMMGNMSAAEVYFKRALKAIDMMEKTNTMGSGALNKAYALLYMGRIMVGQKNYEDAEQYYTKAEKLASSIPNYEILQILYPQKAALAELTGNTENANLYYKKFVELIDETKKVESKDDARRIIFEEQKKHELELIKIDNLILAEKTKRKELTLTLILVITVSILAAAFTLVHLFWSRAKHHALEKKLVEAQNERLEHELLKNREVLDLKKRELSTFMLEMVRKSNLIKNIATRLKEIQNNSATSGNYQIGSLANDIQREEQSKTWKEFEIRFNEVHNNFYQRLSKKFPELTAGDLRLCAFLRLHMSNKEISSVTMQSPESLKTARYRLRKKLNLSRDENLVNYLSKF